MTDNNNIYIDTTTSKKWGKVPICHHCPEEEYPKGKPILPDTFDAKNAKKYDNVNWVCGTCVQIDQRKQSIALLGPNDPSNRRFIKEEEHRVNEWNKVVAEAKRNTGLTRLKMKRNRYKDANNNYNIRGLYDMNRGNQ
jgi:hypothetical protein